MFHRGQQGTSERQGEQWEAGRSNSDGSAVQAEQKIPVYSMSAFCKSLDVAYSPFHTLSVQKSAEWFNGLWRPDLFSHGSYRTADSNAQSYAQDCVHGTDSLSKRFKSSAVRLTDLQRPLCKPIFLSFPTRWSVIYMPFQDTRVEARDLVSSKHNNGKMFS